MCLLARSEGEQFVEMEEWGDGFGVVFVTFGLDGNGNTPEESGSSA